MRYLNLASQLAQGSGELSSFEPTVFDDSVPLRGKIALDLHISHPAFSGSLESQIRALCGVWKVCAVKGL